MTVASLKFCQELYRLSGWSDTPNCYVSESEKLEWIQNKDGSGWHLPAYDLGYLLRKLPPYYVTWGGDQSHWHYGKIEGPRFIRDLNELPCDTPENALAKLCIKLIKQGTLK